MVPGPPSLPPFPSLTQRGARRDPQIPVRGSRAVPSTLVWPWGWAAIPSHATFRTTSASDYAAAPGSMEVQPGRQVQALSPNPLGSMRPRHPMPLAIGSHCAKPTWVSPPSTQPSSGHGRAKLSTTRWWPPLTGKTSGSSLHICRNRSGRAEECSGPYRDQEGEWSLQAKNPTSGTT